MTSVWLLATSEVWFTLNVPPNMGFASESDAELGGVASTAVVVGTFDTKDDNANNGLAAFIPVSTLLSGVCGGVISSY